MNFCLTCRWFTLELVTGRKQSEPPPPKPAPAPPGAKLQASGGGQFEQSYPTSMGFTSRG